MPITTEITLDSELKITREELRRNLRESIILLKDGIKEEFYKRGYAVDGYSKNFSELDKGNNQDKLIRDAIFEFLRPTESAALTVKREDEEKGAKYKLGSFPPEDFQPLVEKTIACKVIMPESIDTILFLGAKSHIAKRKLFNRLTDKSSILLKLQLISLDRGEIIFSLQRAYRHKDLLEKKETRAALRDILKTIPVKLED